MVYYKNSYTLSQILCCEYGARKSNAVMWRRNFLDLVNLPKHVPNIKSNIYFFLNTYISFTYDT